MTFIDHQRIRTREFGKRNVPIPLLNVTATTGGAAQTLFTAQGTSMDIITTVTRLTVTNSTGTAATLTLHVIPSGDALADANMELDAFNVPANTTLAVESLLGGTYPPGHVCKVFSGTNGALTLRGALMQEQ